MGDRSPRESNLHLSDWHVYILNRQSVGLSDLLSLDHCDHRSAMVGMICAARVCELPSHPAHSVCDVSRSRTVGSRQAIGADRYNDFEVFCCLSIG